MTVLMDQITPFLSRRAVKILPVETQGGINLGRVASVQERAWILQVAAISKFAIIIRRLLVHFGRTYGFVVIKHSELEQQHWIPKGRVVFIGNRVAPGRTRSHAWHERGKC